VNARALRRAAALAATLLAVVACGKRGPPVPPQVRFPQAVVDLAATARDVGIELIWTPPRRRVDNTRLFDPGLALVYRAEDTGAGEPRAAIRAGDRIPGYTLLASIRLADPPAPEAQGGRVRYVDRRALIPGRRYTYVVVTTDTQGRMSAPSPRVSVTYLAAPEPPGGVRAEAGDREARLTWEAPTRLLDGAPVSGTLTYEVLRAPDPTTAPTVVGRTGPGQTAFVDREVANDRTYHYAVRAIRAEDGATVVGAPSAAVTATPVKTTPPAPPRELAAIPSRGEVRLSWVASPAPDVGAYIVYRAPGTGPFARVGSVPSPATTFVDRDVPPGRYRYAVSAQDTSARANESARSNEVTVTVP
jgi:hypothetical protein